MLDIKVIKNNPEAFRKAMRSRNKEIDVESIINLDDRRRTLVSETDSMKAEQNVASKDVPNLKKQGKTAEAGALLAKMKE
jgi:seryl-tRNA synthetase